MTGIPTNTEVPQCQSFREPWSTADPDRRREPGLAVRSRELADLGESIKPLDLDRCEKCGRLEFYDHDLSFPER